MNKVLSLALGVIGTTAIAGAAYAVKKNGGVTASVDKLKKHPMVTAAVDKLDGLKQHPTVVEAIDALKQRFAANDAEFVGEHVEPVRAVA
jgi:membrane carboxypeptidase/penicillin-binding protein